MGYTECTKYGNLSTSGHPSKIMHTLASALYREQRVITDTDIGLKIVLNTFSGHLDCLILLATGW